MSLCMPELESSPMHAEGAPGPDVAVDGHGLIQTQIESMYGDVILAWYSSFFTGKKMTKLK